MGSCGFHGSRKAIFMRLLFDDSDESHLMKKKKKKKGRFESRQFQQLGGYEWSPEACLREEHCQRLGNRPTLVSQGQPSTAGDVANTCSLSVREHVWSHIHRNAEEEQEGSVSAHIWNFLQSAVSDSTAAIIKLRFFLSYYGLL